ncbi:MAG TPA: D-hexose-6-phosphate mutarotase [Candidatus Acidoferrales bacterium]|nr:D-hexose-6-phosphate mutarotase [Candidatus Acidoferrales bacterium]
MASRETAADLDRKFGAVGAGRVVEGNGGLPKVAVTAANATGEMYLLGAEVTSWKPEGSEEVLFLSALSKWAPGSAIRGGVPICFPWFGNNAENPKAPAHGFVRAKAWQLESIQKKGDDVTVSMFTTSDSDTKKLWPADFRLVQRATFGHELLMELEMTNTGASPLRFEAALHTYFRVGDISQVRIRGLDGLHYLDKTEGNREKTQRGELTIAAETDSVYLDTPHTAELIDGALRRRIEVSKENSLATVVWNPWTAKAKAMSDLGDDEWKRMACIETCNVGKHAVDLPPGQKHAMKSRIQVIRD